MKTKITEQNYIKANRKASREEELKLYGKQISNRKTVHKSKKTYNRKRDRKIPYFFHIYITKVFHILVIYIHIEKIYGITKHFNRQRDIGLTHPRG